MKILIEAIPHAQHRYPTCGDWFYDEQEPGTLEPTLRIRVSQELPTKSQELVVLHELAEFFMCKANGVDQKSVDDFDMNFEANRHPDDNSEPGDHGDAPYHFQHRLATAIETIAAAQMGVAWQPHENAINRLFE